VNIAIAGRQPKAAARFQGVGLLDLCELQHAAIKLARRTFLTLRHCDLYVVDADDHLAILKPTERTSGEICGSGLYPGTLRPALRMISSEPVRCGARAGLAGARKRDEK
jgi:hypothetical protein